MLKKILTALTLFLGLATTSHAALLATAPLRIDDDEGPFHVLECSVVNVGRSDVEVTMTAVADDQRGPFDLRLAPGASISLWNANLGSSTVLGHCRFDVKGGKKNVRASGCVRANSGSCRAAVPAN